MSENKVIVIDGNNYITRMFYSVDRTKPNWMEEILNRFLTYREKNFESRIIFSFDTCKSKRRLEMFPEYKAHREGQVEESERKQRIDTIHIFMNIMKACGFSVLEGHGYEADDYIACVVAMLKLRNQVVIVSTDQDLWQLVDFNVKVYEPTKMIYIDDENFKYVVEVEKKYYLDYKCMVGDKSDGIPGIPGVGDKTAKKFIEEFGSLQDILNGLSKKETKRQKEQDLITNVAILNRNRKLMSLKIPISDVELQNHIKQKVQNETVQDKTELHKILGACEMGHMYKNFLRICFV